jgi:hypothetical protein
MFSFELPQKPYGHEFSGVDPDTPGRGLNICLGRVWYHYTMKNLVKFHQAIEHYL